MDNERGQGDGDKKRRIRRGGQGEWNNERGTMKENVGGSVAVRKEEGRQGTLGREFWCHIVFTQRNSLASSTPG